MADERLREAERRWRETGEVADEAAYLLERVRTGALRRDLLELAAYCGHEAAVIASGRAPNPLRVKFPSQRAAALVSGLHEWGATTCLRALLWVERLHQANTREFLGVHEVADGPTLEDVTEAEASLDLLQRWIEEPTAEHELAARGRGGLVAEALAERVDARRAARLAGRVANIATVSFRVGGVDDAVLDRLRRDLVAWALGSPAPQQT